MDVINQTVEDYFPCLPCYSCGYLCCFATCGLSLLFPEPCTNELERNVETVLKRLSNREAFLYRGIVWKLCRDKRSRTSWLELRQLVYE
ncbi:hypothetical protein PybrP1_011014 [[Pythium] brassicae (nom. inval.)]|nr:hypothetical protein PybrP1_011014 [[Pythium] brassicae (nom. inval.)]